MRTLFTLLLLAAPARADGPNDNLPDNVRPIPPKGSPISAEDRAELETGLEALQKEIVIAAEAVKGKPALVELLPDVEVYHKAVSYAVKFDEMYVLTDAKTMRTTRNDVPVAKAHLKTGMRRAKELADGKPSWTTATGLVVRGYRSKIDGSVQPYGLVIPKEYDFAGAQKHRLDFWWHGRYENVLELSFIAERERNPGQFTPAGAIVVHPFGRFSNANKFAGEMDTLECLAHVRKHYRIDKDRIVARGFSMGGAACWQFAVHYPTLWCAAAPGAGFSETPEFLNVFQNEKVEPTWYEKKLWRMYNATDYAVNIFNVPTVAYSGEIDRQKQAADVMARELKKVGLELTHIIGPKTGHSYEKNAMAEVNRRIDRIVELGKVPVPREVHLITPTLRYNTAAWITINGIERHWELASIQGDFSQTDPQTGPGYVTPPGGDEFPVVRIKTKKVTSFTIHFEPGQLAARVVLVIDDLIAKPPIRQSDRSAKGTYIKTNFGWELSEGQGSGLKKVHGLQGPIDDAFMDRFLNVKPTGTPLNDKVGAWATKEMAHAVDHWRKQFRGDAPVKDDKAVTDDDIKNANLVLWGDPSSNTVLAKIADKLPVKWTKDGVVLGDKTYDAATHVPVLVFPNPLNPTKYVVLNSGFTFREYDYLNNARQVSKLPDYSILDVTTPPNSRYPGKVVRAGFFGEKWELLPNDGQ